MKVECIMKLVPKTLTEGKIYVTDSTIERTFGVDEYKIINDDGEYRKYPTTCFRVIEE